VKKHKNPEQKKRAGGKQRLETVNGEETKRCIQTMGEGIYNQGDKQARERVGRVSWWSKKGGHRTDGAVGFWEQVGGEVGLDEVRISLPDKN